jgi:microcompartment protein CcmK/EutM
MLIADVIGTVVSPVQHPILDGQRLLLLRPLTPAGERSGPTRIGIDRIGAGVGDRVLVIDEGNSGRQLMSAPEAPVKTMVVAIVDYIDHLESGAQLTFDARHSPRSQPEL